MVTKFYKFFLNLINKLFYIRLTKSLKCTQPIYFNFLSDKYIYKSIDKGYAILYQEYNFGKQGYILSNFNSDLTNLSVESLKNIHSFNWLQDLKVIDTHASNLRIYDLIDSWINKYGFFSDKVDKIVFEYTVLASRIFNWLTTPNISSIKEPNFKDKFFSSLSFQIRLFLKLYNIKLNYSSWLLINKTLFAIGKSTNAPHLVNLALENIVSYLRKTVLADGGMLDNSPSAVLSELGHILFVFRSLDNEDTSFKNEIRTFIDKIVIFIKSVSYKDGGLGVFNGGYEEDSNKISFLLSMGNISAKVFNNLRYSGYLNITSNNIDVMLKTNASFPDKIKSSSYSNNSILSQEILLYGERIFVNNTTNSSFIDQKLNRSAFSSVLFYDKSNKLIDMPCNLSYHECTTVHKTDQYYNSIIVTYKGLVKSHGLTWYKTLSLAKNKNCLLGEEVIGLENRSCIGKVILKFILHPSVIVKSNSIDENNIVLEVNNEEWIFQANNTINIKNELYQAIKDELFPTISINIPMDMEDKKTIEWILTQKDQLRTNYLQQKYSENKY